MGSVEALLILAVPTLQRILCGVTQLPDGGPDPFAELDVELDGSNSVFVGIHELPPGSPSFRPHPLAGLSGSVLDGNQQHEAPFEI